MEALGTQQGKNSPPWGKEKEDSLGSTFTVSEDVLAAFAKELSLIKQDPPKLSTRTWCSDWREVILIIGSAMSTVIVAITIFKGESFLALLSGSVTLVLLFALYLIRSQRELLDLKGQIKYFQGLLFRANEIIQNLWSSIENLIREVGFLGEEREKIGNENVRLQEVRRLLESVGGSFEKGEERLEELTNKLISTENALEITKEQFREIAIDMQGSSGKVKECVDLILEFLQGGRSNDGGELLQKLQAIKGKEGATSSSSNS